jgi:hypothetical protein
MVAASMQLGLGTGGVTVAPAPPCAVYDASQARGRAKLGGMPFSLPAFQKLTPVQQLFVVVNLERTERGLAAAAVLSRSLNAVAQARKLLRVG